MSRQSEIFPEEEQTHFWSVVRECIRMFHADQAAAALAATTRLSMKIDTVPLEQMELFYHAEPFDVACDLADNQLDVRDYAEEYLKLRNADIAAPQDA